jgi:hypothetical protein
LLDSIFAVVASPLLQLELAVRELKGNGVFESDKRLRNWPEFADFDAGAGDEIRTHDSLLGKQILHFSKLERAQNPGFETLTMCFFCPLSRTSQRVTT